MTVEIAPSWDSSLWELRTDLPMTLDLCYGRGWSMRTSSYMGLWHTPSCHPEWDRGNGAWVTGIPVEVAVQMWPTATATAPIGYCQLCVIERTSLR